MTPEEQQLMEFIRDVVTENIKLHLREIVKLTIEKGAEEMSKAVHENYTAHLENLLGRLEMLELQVRQLQSIIDQEAKEEFRRYYKLQ